jgi:hypothetical protein
VSDKSGRNEVYLQPYPGPGEEWTISTEGGSEPVWARSTGQLFYRQGEGMFVVDIAKAGAFAVGKPRLVFNADYVRSSPGLYANYDVTPDGQRFLMIKSGNRTAVTTQINVVLNWFDELRRLVPTQ